MHFIKEFLEKFKENGSFIVFDTETTGLSTADCDIIEFAAEKFSYGEDGFKLISKIDIYIDPGHPIPKEITELTGITTEYVKGKNTIETGYKAIKEFFGDNPVIAGYNVSFDVRFVSALYSKCGDDFTPRFALDILKMAKEKLPKPHKLINVCDTLELSGEIEFHRACDDVRATVMVFEKLLPEYDNAVDGGPLTVTGLSRWAKYGFDRIYITNKENASAFYDVTGGKWEIPSDYDEEKTIKAVLVFAGVEDEKDLAKSVA